MILEIAFLPKYKKGKKKRFKPDNINLSGIPLASVYITYRVAEPLPFSREPLWRDDVTHT